MKIFKETKSNSLFLAAILFTGIILSSSLLFMTASAQAERDYRMDDYDKKSSGKDVSVKSIKCNNVNVNVNGLELNVLPPSLSTLLTGGEADDNAYSYGSGERSYGSGGQSGYDNKNSFKFVCINNNNNTVIGVDDEETPTPIEPTCEECFTEILTPEQISDLEVLFAGGGVTIQIGPESVTFLSFAGFCNFVLERATTIGEVQFLVTLFLNAVLEPNPSQQTIRELTTCVAEVVGIDE